MTPSPEEEDFSGSTSQNTKKSTTPVVLVLLVLVSVLLPLLVLFNRYYSLGHIWSSHVEVEGENGIAHHRRGLRTYRHSNSGQSRNVYIDLGTNNGDSIKSFFNRIISTVDGIHTDGSVAVKGGWKTILARADKQSIDPSTWHVIAVEANQAYTPRLLQIHHNLSSMIQIASMKIYNGTAIGNRDGSVALIWDEPYGPQEGATIMADSYSTTEHSVTVPIIDIVTLLRREHITIEDFVVIKMDIEGAEYDVMKRILLSGVYRYIDKMAIEWHHNAFYVFGKPYKTSPKREVRTENHAKYKARYEALLWMMEGLKNAPVLFEWG